MNRGELVRLLVLNAIANDYENVDQVILGEVGERLAKMGMTIERPEKSRMGTGFTVPNPNSPNVPSRPCVDSAACPHAY